jgi:hypothetical protein
MDGTRLQALIYRGYAKEAAHIGIDYEIFRGPPMTPMQSAYSQGSLPCAFLADAKASVSMKYQTPTWILRADGSQLDVLDILVGPFGTFYVASMQPSLPLEAVRCNTTVSIGRVSYQQDPVSGVLMPVVTNYAEGLPMFKQYRREEIRKDPTTGQEIGNATTVWRAFIPLANESLLQGDVIIDENNINYTVDAPDFTSAGYAANIRLASL